MAPPEFSRASRPPDDGWRNPGEQLGGAAHEIRISASPDEPSQSARLLAIAGNLAALAMGMLPLRGTPREAPVALVDAWTLVATQILQHRPCPTRAVQERIRIAEWKKSHSTL